MNFACNNVVTTGDFDNSCFRRAVRTQSCRQELQDARKEMNWKTGTYNSVKEFRWEIKHYKHGTKFLS